jgi:hypothetical protein
MLTVFAIGALMVGNVDLAREFRAKAREDLSRYFDMSDYSVAQALVALAYLDSRIGDADGATHLYYLRLGMEICRQLGARHTDVYLRCLLLLAVSSQVPKDELPELCRECEFVQTQPYDPLYSMRSFEALLPMAASNVANISFLGRVMLRAVTGMNLLRSNPITRFTAIPRYMRY